MLEQNRRRAVFAASIGLPVAVLVGVLVAAKAALHEDSSSAVTVTSIAAPQGDSASCTALAAALPDTVGTFEHVDIVDAPAATHAWRDGDGTVVLRCGIGAPPDFFVGSALQEVNGVQWFLTAGADSAFAGSTDGTVTYVAVDRDVYVALSAPPNSGATPLQTISDVVTGVLPAVAPSPLPLPGG